MLFRSPALWHKPSKRLFFTTDHGAGKGHWLRNSPTAQAALPKYALQIVSVLVKQICQKRQNAAVAFPVDTSVPCVCFWVILPLAGDIAGGKIGALRIYAIAKRRVLQHRELVRVCPHPSTEKDQLIIRGEDVFYEFEEKNPARRMVV